VSVIDVFSVMSYVTFSSCFTFAIHYTFWPSIQCLNFSNSCVTGAWHVPKYFAISRCAHIIQLLTVYDVSHLSCEAFFSTTHIFLSEVLNVIFIMSTSLHVFEFSSWNYLMISRACETLLMMSFSIECGCAFRQVCLQYCSYWGKPQCLRWRWWWWWWCWCCVSEWLLCW